MAKKRNIGITKANQFVQKIQSQGIRIDKAYLFGSYATGVPRPDSDIDIAIVSQDFSGNRSLNWDRWIRYRRSIDLRIEPVFYRTDDFKDEDPLVWQIKKTGIEITI